MIVWFTIFAIVIMFGIYLFINYRTTTTTIRQSQPSTKEYTPKNGSSSIKINAEFYTMQLPNDWKQLSVNKDSRYSSTEWQLQSGGKNRWLTLYTDRLPTDTAFNRILPVTTKDNTITAGTLSDNCSNFTTKISDTNLKTPSKWQKANFLCDLSNATDNVIGVSDRTSGTALSLTGITKGTHTYMFVYTDRGIPEDETPLTLALQSLRTK